MPNEIIVVINGREEKIPQSRNEYLLLELLKKIVQDSEKKVQQYFCDTSAELPQNTDAISVGSVCAVINESKFYVLNSQKEWKLWDAEDSATNAVSPTSLSLNKEQLETIGIPAETKEIQQNVPENKETSENV